MYLPRNLYFQYWLYGDIAIAMVTGTIRNAARWLDVQITWWPLFGGSLSGRRAGERRSVDTMVTYKRFLGLNQPPSWDWRACKMLIQCCQSVGWSGNNADSMILFGHHSGMSPLRLQCLGRLSWPIAPSVPALAIAVGPIYQHGTLKNHIIV